MAATAARSLPMGTMTVADLKAVAHWERHIHAGPVKDTLNLLRSCLQHRLGHDHRQP
jgi:hypothetical protein